MRFVLVNGRSPRQNSFCAMCCEPIGAGYVREIATELLYCDRDCYLNRGIRSVPALPYRGSVPQAELSSAQKPVANLTLDSIR